MPPRHKIVAHLIQSSIADGNLVAGQRLPPEDELARHYGVSAAQMHLTIAHLKNAGLVTINAGGVAIGDPPVQSHTTALPASCDKPAPTQDSLFRQSADQVGLTATQRVDADIRPALAEAADKLEIEIGQQVLCRRTVRFANELPTEMEETYYPCDLAGAELTALGDLIDDFLHGLGWTRVACEDTLTARRATDSEAALFGIDNGDPVIDRARVRFAVRDQTETRPVSYTSSVLVGGRHRLTYVLKQPTSPRS